MPSVASLAPQTYTPRHLAQKILASREALSGERKQVTVVFADVVGSTELIRDLDPEDAQRLLDGTVQRMMDAVHRYEGTVSRLMGDGLMAMFGAPVAHEDHAVRACYAALAMLDSVRGYAEEARQAYRAAPEIRVGLNSGEVIVRLISDDLHMDYTAMGQTVHLAARMEGLANAGTVLLSPSSLALAEGFVEVRPLGPMPVKGLAQPLNVYELVGASMARTRLQASAARGLTPFVGRAAELDALERALDRAGDGHGQVVAPVGEPGVGKSRLLYEFVHAHRTRNWLVLESGSVTYGKATSYLPIIDLLKSYCRIEPRDDARAVREKLTGKLLALDPSLAAIHPPLLWLLDVPVEDEAWATLDPPRRREAILTALRRLLIRESQEQPLLLVFEDLHWIDAETQAFLDSMVEMLPTARILLLVNYRPEYTHSWGNKSYYTQLRIDPLGPVNADELLAALLGKDPNIQPLKSMLIERTDGNPFFLEESVRSLAETGALVGERGNYRLHNTVDSMRVPSTVQAVLAARIDRLPPEDKRLLQTAAVIGKDVPFILLQAIADGTDAELQAGIARLQAAELLYAVSLFPDLELTFKHALTHEVAYGSLLQERRRPLHAKIVEAIEVLYPDRLDEQVERLAHHAQRGQVWEKAVTYSRDAGVRAMARSAGLEAIDHLERAVVALEHLPSDPSRIPLSIDLRFELRTALASRFRYERAQQVLEQAQALATASGDRVRLGWVEAYLAHHMRSTVNHQRAIDHGEHALAIAAETGDRGLRRTAADMVAQSYHEIGEFQRVLNLLGPFVASVDAASADEIGPMDIAASVTSRNVVALCLAWQGNAREAIECVEEGIRVAEHLGHLQTIASANNWSGLVYALGGDIPRAIERTERGLAIRRSLDGDPHPSLFAFLGYVYTQGGRVEEAIRALEHSLAGAKEISHFACTALWTSWLADAYQRAGRLDEAKRTATRAIEMGRNHRERPFEGYALLQLGLVTLDESLLDAPRAEQYFWDALTIADELGMRPLQAHTHLSLGKLYRRTGRTHEARSEFNVAVDLYLTMEMSHWVPEAEAEIALLPETDR